MSVSDLPVSLACFWKSVHIWGTSFQPSPSAKMNDLRKNSHCESKSRSATLLKPRDMVDVRFEGGPRAGDPSREPAGDPSGSSAAAPLPRDMPETAPDKSSAAAAAAGDAAAGDSAAAAAGAGDAGAGAAPSGGMSSVMSSLSCMPFMSICPLKLITPFFFAAFSVPTSAS